MPQPGPRRFDRAIRIAVHAGAILPLAWLLWDFLFDNLSVNPIEDVQLRTGRFALILLVVSLACTPLSRILRIPRILSYRRALGLYAFTYTCLHLLNFLALDYGFDLGLIREDLFEKWYALVGLGAFLLLLPLAVTSTAGWRRRLGRGWFRLHRLAYAAAVLAVAHFTLQTRGDITLPLVYIAVVSVLLLARVPILRRAAGRLRG
jgi:sulfoxide reductase heme-binding subunit YedZ